MSRPLRYTPGGMVFHVLNRGVGRRTLFDKDQDFLEVEKGTSLILNCWKSVMSPFPTRPIRRVLSLLIQESCWAKVTKKEAGYSILGR
jgi:hypothetical protein